MSVIAVESLTKSFGSFKALDSLDLTVEAGSVHGFLGPNGSGKSTTIRTLLGLLHPDSGSVRVFGANPVSDPAVLKRVAYVPGDVALWPQLTGRETLDALASLRGRPVDPVREAELIEAFTLDPSKKVRSYSTGNRRKVALIAALSAGAELLILDEPTAGLDPLKENVFTEQIRSERERGATVLLSSHIMSEVEKLCDTVTVIKDGRAVESGPLEALRHLSTYTVAAVTRASISNEAVERALADSGVEAPPTWPAPHRIEVQVARDQVAAAVGALAALEPEELLSMPASLEEIFLEHYETGAR